MFCAVGSAAVMTTPSSTVSCRSSATPSPHATTGITTSLRAEIVSTSRLCPDCPIRGLSRSAAPYDSSISGMAALASSSSGEATTVGSSQPVTASTTPSTAATVSGFVTSRRSIARVPVPRPVTRSSTIRQAGCTTSICTRSVGTTTVMSPTTYAAIASPRLPALTYDAESEPITSAPVSTFHRSRASSA